MKIARRWHTITLFVWVLTLLALVVSACGAVSLPASNTPPPGNPDSVRLEVAQPGPKQPALMLKNNPLVQQLYTEAYSLSAKPPFVGCSADAGPVYTLTFFQKGKTLVTVHANSAGCEEVNISGEGSTRQASAKFWSLVHGAFSAATPPAHPTQFSRLLAVTPTQRAQIQHVTSPTQAQHLYNAILALPPGPVGNIQHPAYWLSFQSDKQTVLATVDIEDKCIWLDGNNITRGGWYKVNQQFIDVLNTAVDGVPFSPARPDQLSVEMNARTVTTSKVTDHALMQQFYNAMMTLPQSQQQQLPTCVGDDKIHQRGTWYTFKFSQWGLPIFQAQAYEGCQNFVLNLTPESQIYLQDNAKVWSLVHQVFPSPDKG